MKLLPAMYVCTHSQHTLAVGSREAAARKQITVTRRDSHPGRGRGLPSCPSRGFGHTTHTVHAACPARDAGLTCSCSAQCRTEGPGPGRQPCSHPRPAGGRREGRPELRQGVSQSEAAGPGSAATGWAGLKESRTSSLNTEHRCPSLKRSQRTQACLGP